MTEIEQGGGEFKAKAATPIFSFLITYLTGDQSAMTRSTAKKSIATLVILKENERG